MRDRRRPGVVSWSRFFWFTLVVVVSCVLFTGFSFSTFRLLLGGGRFHPVLGSTRRTQAISAVSSESPVSPVLTIRETVVLPDQALLFLKYPPSAPLFTIDDLDCLYLSPNGNTFKQPPAQVDAGEIVRCPAAPRGSTVALALKSNELISVGPSHRWDSLAYEALIDRDNTTIVFVKGLNLRPARVANASRFECVYGWDFRRPKLLLRSEVLSVAQEIVRCRTPLSVLQNGQVNVNNSIKVSVRVKGRGILHSIAHPGRPVDPGPPPRKPYQMCVCTMVRNQARFLKEWVMYHSKIGVQRWFIYDNNSDDDTSSVIESLLDTNYSVSRHVWPWVKTQEAGFAHCALRARDSCDWVGFIDVDEFFHLPSGLMLPDMLKNFSSISHGSRNRTIIGEFRVSCYSFGPSGLKQVPAQGVTVGYTCRVAAPERHKSIVRPEALNSTLINVVHHFHLRSGFRFMNVKKGVMVVNHYKFQVWEVFKEKFYRRVATYVADWQDEENVGSKDRTPGLGTRAVEPTDWSERFCEVRDTGLRDRVLQNFVDPKTRHLPWEDEQDGGGEEAQNSLVEEGKIKSSRKHRRKHRSTPVGRETRTFR